MTTHPGGVVAPPPGARLLVVLEPHECVLVAQPGEDYACVRAHPAPVGGHRYVSGALLARARRALQRDEPPTP